MFTPTQLTQIYDYIKYCKFEAQRKAREAEELANTHVLTEQNRRERELTRLERAIEAEIDGATKGSRNIMPSTYRKPKTPRYRPKSEAQKQRRREEVKNAGGWFLWHRQQRERREAEARQNAHDKIRVYPQRQVIDRPTNHQGG